MIFVMSFVVLTLFVLPFFAPARYLSELLISFLPYMVVVSFLFSFCLLALFFLKLFTKSFLKLLLLLFSCSFVVIWLLGSSRIYKFYFSWHGLEQTFSTGVSLLYANVYVENFDYSWLNNVIVAYDPDILVFVEYGWHHFAAMESFLHSRYSYINRDHRDRGYDGTLLASRYEFVSMPVFVDGVLDLERYYSSHLGLDLSVVHTAAPVTYWHYLQRWQQLEHLLTHFSWLDALVDGDGQHYIVLWDFNLSPWSIHYGDFVTKLSLWWLDVSKFVPFAMSRSAPVIDFLQSHIDHFFVKDFPISSIAVVPIPWSDHNGYFVHLSVPSF